MVYPPEERRLISPGGTFGPPHNNELLWNMTRHVYAPQAPRLGQSYALEFHGAPGQVVLPAAAFQPRHTWLGDLGVLGLDPASLVTGVGLPFDNRGRADLTFQIPNDSSLLGVHIYWQGLIADSSAPQPYRLTNTFEDVFGQ